MTGMNLAFEKATKAMFMWRRDNDLTIKARWKASSKVLFNVIAHHLGAEPVSVKFNQGGTAVSGECYGFCKLPDGRIFYMNLGADFPGYVRTARSTSDYTGDRNFSITLDAGYWLFETDIESFRKSLG